MKRNIIPGICLILVLAFVVGCGGATGSAADKIIGQWNVDIDSLMQTPEIKAQLEAMPELEEMMAQMFEAMVLEITATEIKVEAMGESEIMPYTVVSSTADLVEISVDGETETIKVINDSQIEVTIEGQTLVLKK